MATGNGTLQDLIRGLHARPPAIWQGSKITDCQVCNGPILNVFYDGKTWHGPWAIMCPECHRKAGVGVGLAKGQRYERKAEGIWLKSL